MGFRGCKKIYTMWTLHLDWGKIYFVGRLVGQLLLFCSKKKRHLLPWASYLNSVTPLSLTITSGYELPGPSPWLATRMASRIRGDMWAKMNEDSWCGSVDIGDMAMIVNISIIFCGTEGVRSGAAEAKSFTVELHKSIGTGKFNRLRNCSSCL